MKRYVAFLRAINTPGRHVKMERLREVFESMDFDNIDTFIASGNVVFDAEADPSPDRIEGALEADLGLTTLVYLRTGDEVVALADLEPFGGEVDAFEVSFLPAEPDPGAVAALLETVPDTDRLKVVGREVYWWTPLPHGDSGHREGTVVGTLGMETTRRAIRTVRRIADRYLR